MTGQRNGHDVIREELARIRRENPSPWWYGWFTWDELPMLLVTLGFVVFVICLMIGSS